MMAIKELETIKDYKNASEKIVACQNKIEEIKNVLETKRIEEEEKRIAEELRKKRKKKLVVIIADSIAILIALYFPIKAIYGEVTFNKAVKLMENGNEKAVAKITEIRNLLNERNRICKMNK